MQGNKMSVFKRLTKKHSKFICVFVLLVINFLFFYLNYINNQQKTQEIWNESDDTVKTRLKYLLLWTGSRTTPFIYFGTGSKMFRDKKCEWTNCYVTTDRHFLLGDYTEFDVIAFNGPQLAKTLAFGDIPIRRYTRQKYVYANIEASANYPICTNVWNDFFNWTWTYKLNSDAVWGYFAVRNASGDVIGPKEIMHWLKPDEMDDIDENLKNKLRTKNQLAAWFVSNCNTQSLREEYVAKLQEYLKKINMEVNIFGKCGKFDCPRELMSRCLKTLEKNYFFYLAFENAISEDYVTERIVYALNHNTVPIVFGGANYSRFMPEGAYLNAYNMKPEKLAAKMYQIVKNSSKYHQFFRWKKYYTFQLRPQTPDTDDYCKFCAMMNDKQLMQKTTIYTEINKWWTGPDMEQICHPTINPNINQNMS